MFTLLFTATPTPQLNYGKEKPKVSPVVNIQSGAARLIPLLIPPSIERLDSGGVQIKPIRAELLGEFSRTLSTSTSTPNLSLRAKRSAPITPQNKKGLVCALSTAPPKST